MRTSLRARTIVGWGLIAVGVGLMGYAVFSSAQVFTGATDPPQLFAFEESTEQDPPSSFGSIEEQAERMVQEQFRDVIPPEEISRFLNLVVWSLFAGLLLFAGPRFAGIGINLLSSRSEERDNEPVRAR